LHASIGHYAPFAADYKDLRAASAAAR